MDISIVKNNDKLIIALAGILDMFSAVELKNILIDEFSITDAIPSDIEHMIIDLSSLESISAAGIGIFAALQSAFNNSNKTLSFVSVPQPLSRLFEITNLYDHFSVYGSLKDVENSTGRCGYSIGAENLRGNRATGFTESAWKN